LVDERRERVFGNRRHAAVSLDDLVGKQEQRARECQAQSVRGFQIGHQRELGGLVDRDVARFGSVELVLGAALLVAVSRALARIELEHDGLRWSPVVRLVDPLAGKIGESSKIFGSAQLSRFVPNLPIWQGRSCGSSDPRPLTTQRIAGSRHSLSALFTSS
jgi:hypothetical protein